MQTAYCVSGLLSGAFQVEPYVSQDLGPHLQPQFTVELLGEGALEHDDYGERVEEMPSPPDYRFVDREPSPLPSRG